MGRWIEGAVVAALLRCCAAAAISGDEGEASSLTLRISGKKEDRSGSDPAIPPFVK